MKEGRGFGGRRSTAGKGSTNCRLNQTSRQTDKEEKLSLQGPHGGNTANILNKPALCSLPCQHFYAMRISFSTFLALTCLYFLCFLFCAGGRRTRCLCETAAVVNDGDKRLCSRGTGRLFLGGGRDTASHRHCTWSSKGTTTFLNFGFLWINSILFTWTCRTRICMGRHCTLRLLQHPEQRCTSTQGGHTTKLALVLSTMLREISKTTVRVLHSARTAGSAAARASRLRRSRDRAIGF